MTPAAITSTLRNSQRLLRSNVQAPHMAVADDG
jgi:hypothetical protein